MWAKFAYTASDAYALFDPADIEAANDILYSQKVTGKQKQRLTFFLQKSKKLLEHYEYETQRQAVADMRGFVRYYEFLLQISSFEDTDLHKKYNFISYLLAYINIKHPGGGFNLDGKIKASQFVQKKGEEHVSSDLVAKPVMKLPTTEHFGLSEDKEKRLSEIIDEINSKTSPIDYATLKACPELEKMEYFGNPQGSLFKLTKGEYDFIYDMIRDENPAPPAADSIEKYDKEKFFNDVYMTEAKYDRLVAVLKKKKNIILQGAPGVGKTFAAKRLAYSIIAEKDDDRIEFVQFHQNYSYEDFMMGYKPVEDGFELKYGIFYRFCQKAANHPDKDYFFIIDEINRGNMSKIFGELLMLIEADYRDTKATLAYNGLSFSVPKRLHIIGMMNTADRSLAMIDYALRRRFSFFDMEPGFDSEGFIKYQEGFANDTFNTLIDRIKELNQEIAKDKSLGKGFCIGHSYFCNTDECTEEWMQDVVNFDVLPMLAEYWFDDTDKLQRWENILHGVFQ